MLRRPALALLFVALTFGAGEPARGQEADAPAPPPEGDAADCDVALALDAEPRELTVGDRVQVQLELTAPAGFRPAEIVSTWGDFEVLAGSWTEVESTPCARWTWTGSLTAFETGELELPPRAVHPDDGGRTEALTLAVRSLLAESEAAGEGVELADLKDQASIAPSYTLLWLALGMLAVLLAFALAIWWVQRRYGDQLTAPPPPDPFEHVSPHQWVYAELQRLLERRLAESGDVDLFYAELTRILKRFLGGRFRVDLMERTTTELPERLHQAGAPEETIRAVVAILETSDGVKFAGDRPGPDAWRTIVEDVYRVVDATKPPGAVGPPVAASRPAGEGAA